MDILVTLLITSIVASGDFVVVYLLVVIFVVFLIICNKAEKFRGLSLHVLVYYRILQTHSHDPCTPTGWITLQVRIPEDSSTNKSTRKLGCL